MYDKAWLDLGSIEYFTTGLGEGIIFFGRILFVVVLCSGNRWRGNVLESIG